MTSASPRNLRARKLLFVAILLLICISIGLGVYHRGEWSAPEDAKKLKNPVPLSQAALDSARTLYLDKCANCHGDSGKGDGSDAMMYDPGPADLTDAKHMDRVTDGEIFYQITAGKKPMPSFRKRLTEEQRWQLVYFVRAFAAPAASNPGADKKPASPSK